MRSTLNGPISAHSTYNAAGVMRILASCDGREIASATPFSAVGIHSNDNMKQYSTWSSNNLDQQCVSLTVPSTLPVKRVHYRLVVHVDEHLHSPQHVRVSCTKLP